MSINVDTQQIGSKSGTYTGDGSADKAIAHGLGSIPKLVFIIGNNATTGVLLDYQSGYITSVNGGARYAVTAQNVTNFYVGDAGSYINSMNEAVTEYYWVAIK